VKINKQWYDDIELLQDSVTGIVDEIRYDVKKHSAEPIIKQLVIQQYLGKEFLEAPRCNIAFNVSARILSCANDVLKLAYNGFIDLTMQGKSPEREKIVGEITIM